MIVLNSLSGGRQFPVHINPSQVRHLFQHRDGVVKIIFSETHHIYVEGVAAQVADKFAAFTR